MSRRAVRMCTAALLAGVLAVSAGAVFHRLHEDAARHRHHLASFAVTLADTVAPTGKVAQPGVAGAAVAPAAARVAAGAPVVGSTVDSDPILPSRTAGTAPVRGPPGEAAA